MTTVEYYDREALEFRPAVVRYRKRKIAAGYEVDLRAPAGTDGDRWWHIGWVVQDRHDGTWSAHVASGAFRGDGTTGDRGHSLDRVPLGLFNGMSTIVCDPISEGERIRDEAAAAIITWLHRYFAPAAGYPAHPNVRPWDTCDAAYR